jgi:two-component system sensor kinase FixL
MVRVTDDGEGISADVQESLFEAFVTTKASGLGLGLSICQEVAREHGAQLTLKNRNDRRGAIAEVVFPILGPHSHSAISSMTEDPIRETQEAST